MARSFSIVINTYNRAHTLRNSLKSLDHLRHENFEVVVVNGPSTDDTDLILAEFSDRIRIGNCPDANLSMSRNVGIAMARGEIVCFMDDDAVPEPDWLDQLEVGYSESIVGAVGGFIRDHTGVTFQSKVVVCDRFGDSQHFESVSDAAIVDGPRAERYLTLTGTNSSFRRTALMEIGGFDEEYAYFLDETDVIVRLIDAGYQVRYVPSAEIHHKYAESHLRTQAKIPKSMYLPVRSKTYFCVRNGMATQTLDRIFDYIHRYHLAEKRDKKWLVDNKYIEHDHYRHLIEEIHRAIHDGIHDAFAYPNRRLICQQQVQKSVGAFLRHAPMLPAKERLRLCFTSQEYPPRGCGGIGMWTHELATALAALGHEVSVVTRGEEHPTVDFEEGVWVHRIVPLHHPERSFPDLPDLPQTTTDYAYSVYDEVMRIVLRRGLDLVSSPIWDLEGAACIADGSIPSVLSLHSTYKLVLPTKDDWLGNEQYRRLHVDKIVEGEKWAMEKALHVIANSHAIVKDIERTYSLKLPAHRCSVIPHGIRDVVNKRTPMGRENVRDSVHLLYVGRFEKRKGVDLLLEILPRLVNEFPNLVVTLVGENTIAFNDSPPLMQRFLQRYENAPFLSRIKFTGFVSEDELIDLYSKCDVFVAPSRYESFGLIFLEAMRFGKPCIGSNIGGIPEVIDDGQCGLLAGPGDAMDLYRKLSALLSDSSLRAAIGKAARAAFLERFTEIRMAEQAIRAYHQILSAHRLASEERDGQLIKLA